MKKRGRRQRDFWFDLIEWGGNSESERKVKLDCKPIVQGRRGRGEVMKKAADNTQKSFKSVRFRKVYGKIHSMYSKVKPNIRFTQIFAHM